MFVFFLNYELDGEQYVGLVRAPMETTMAIMIPTTMPNPPIDAKTLDVVATPGFSSSYVIVDRMMIPMMTRMIPVHFVIRNVRGH